MSNDVNYFEIGSPDAQASRAFYGGLFGWTFGEPSMPARYSMIENDKGGLWDTSAMGGTSWAIFYVQVDNVKQRSTGPKSWARPSLFRSSTTAGSSSRTSSTHMATGSASGSRRTRNAPAPDRPVRSVPPAARGTATSHIGIDQRTDLSWSGGCPVSPPCVR